MRLSAIVNSIKSQETIDSYQLIPRVKRRWNGKSITKIQMTLFLNLAGPEHFSLPSVETI